ELKKLDQQIGALSKTIAAQQGIIDATGLHSQSAATAMGSAIAGTFATLVRGGASFTDAIAQISPAVDAMGAQLAATGFSGGAVFAALQGQVALAHDAIAGPALEAVNSLGQGIVALGNMGLLD